MLHEVCFSLNMFLVNAGQSWDAARKCILYGLLRDENDEPITADSEQYDQPPQPTSL